MLSAQTAHERTRGAVYRQKYFDLLSENFAVCHTEGGRSKREMLERKEKKKNLRHSRWGLLYLI
jgi:hypothetical protein